MKILCFGCMEEYEGDYDVCPYCGYVQGTPAKEAYHITPGVMLKGRYKVGRVLGSGGFGITYIGYDMILEKKVAIKEYLPTEFATRMPNQTMVTVYTGEKQEQFLAGMKKSLDEAKRLAEFQQTPGITQVFDFFEENNTAYIVMELLEGETLKDKLKRDGKMTVEEALPIILAVIGALKAVHTKSIIHRDIAPDNIYLLKNGEVKLLDFGASRQVTTTHSKSLTVILKLGYAPVEQYQSGGNQGPWTDVYALAATFYKMITGNRPPESPERRIRDTLKEPSKLGVVIDKNIENALMNALHVRIEDRTKSAEEFENALYSPECQRTEATVEKVDMGRWPRWLKVLCAVAGAGVMTFGILLATGVIVIDLPELPSFSQTEGTAWMPSLVNMSQDDAKARLEELGLKCEIGGTEPSDTIMKGYVLGQADKEGQKIEAGDEIPIGTKVYVTISSGNGKTEIPDILWMDEATARARLTDAELIAINTTEDTESWAPAGVVTGAEPEIGTEIKLEEVITLKIASGNSVPESGKAEIPDLTGVNEQAAYNQMKEAGLFFKKENLEYSTTVEKGNIISQSPAAGTEASKGDTVTVIVSDGPKQVQLISVVGQTEAEARTALEGLGVTVSVTQDYSDTVEAGRVITQSIEPGSVSEGTEVVLTVSRGVRPAETTRANTGRGNTGGGNTGGGNTGGGNTGGGNTGGESNAAVTAPTAPAPPPTTAPKPTTDPDTDW
ncbi:MAG: PASTA domain-containing protein [Lachnospiraceae bacterium]|nr:PASTA domain-containing protein [Lachnospiraceae bacterium]